MLKSFDLASGRLPAERGKAYAFTISAKASVLPLPQNGFSKDTVDEEDGILCGRLSFGARENERTLEFCTDYRNCFSVFCDADGFDEDILSARSAADSPTHLFMTALLSVFKPETEMLAQVEKRIGLTEELVLKNKRLSENARDIGSFRKLLSSLEKRYECLEEVNVYLTAFSAEMSQNASALLTALVKKGKRLLDKVNEMKIYVSELRDSYQSQVDIRQNKLMKTFTVITAIFMPLQLITGWYGMNLIMPEKEYALTYPILIAVAGIFVVICVWLFKKNKYL